ncbi:MAG: hypothetical protein KFW07_00565 [Mycoplasmataceae bacterium]|nr:hypothetical protein [Mycoplasmataceae bacterium]
MTYEATQSLDLLRDKGYITKNRDILTKKIRWDNYLKAGSYLLYSIFIALVSVSFLFSKANEIDLSITSIDLVGIFIALFAGLFSMGLISWIYKGSLKKLFIINYYITHLINGLLLSVLMIVLSLPMFSYSSADLSIINETAQIRSLIFGIGLIAWSFIGGVVLVIGTYRLKGVFPNSWLKAKLSMVTIVIFPIIAMLSWSSSLNPSIKEIIYWVQLMIFLSGLLYSGFAFSYVRAFKESLLADKTEQEIQKIDVLRNISFLAILMSSITLAVLGIYKALPIWEQWSNGEFGILSFVSVVIDAVVLIMYLTIIIWAKKMGEKNKSNKFLSTIDNVILMEFISWLLLIKTVVIVGFSKGVDISSFMSLSSCFIGIFIINISTILLGVNFPNIKNTTSTIVNVVAALAVLGMTLFQSTYPKQASSAVFESTEIIILTLLPFVIATSMNLSIKLLSYSKIKNDHSSEGKENNESLNMNSKIKKSANANKVKG